jgi:hypothetical protein
VTQVFKSLVSVDSLEQGFYNQLAKVPHRGHKHSLIKAAGIGPSEIRKRYLPDVTEQKIQEALTILLQDQAMLISKVGIDNKL